MRPHLLRTVLRHTRGQPGVNAPGSPDADLLHRFVVGRDEAAFAELVRRHARLVWGVCRNLLPNPADADDAFQATFLALVRSAGRVRDARALGGWLHGTAYRVCQKVRRSAARRRRRERAAAVGEAAAPVADAAWDELLAAVHEEVCRLPDNQRVPFVLCCLEGKGVTEAAAELGWKLGTFSGRLTRAKQELLARLARRGIAPGVAAAAAATGGVAATAAAPPRLIAAALGLVRPGAAIPDSILSLSQGLTQMTRTKLLVAGTVLAAAVGVSIWSAGVPTADAQQGLPGGAANPFNQGGFAQGFGQGGGRIGGPARTGDPAAGVKWEYKFINFGASDHEKQANDLGNDGWEMVGANNGTQFIFKRLKAGRRAGLSAPTADATITRDNMTTVRDGMTTVRDNTTTEIIQLKHASAADLSATIQPLFSTRAAAVAETRSNSLILRGDPDTVAEVKKMVEKLDSLSDGIDPTRKRP